MASLNTISGVISFKEENGKLTHLTWGNTYSECPCSTQIINELGAYFTGNDKKFNIPLEPKGTAFQKKVWHYLLTIPYGALKTYKDVAIAVGSHPRAVGGAVGKNPIPIIIPCHRVVASNGKMCGFSGGEGIKTKEILLKHEQLHK
tara:strand:- start:107421 stop:107858 length:438 start_codon:yes stop_codon:yes gene_type:complete